MPLLFSYGTLRQAEVQSSAFGRALSSTEDELVGYTLSSVRITDAEFIATTGKAIHANVVFNGRIDSRVPGAVLEITEDELLLCDRYEERARYIRVKGTLVSGREAWVYAFAG
jgi:gamma-glutamylcyclotransferase (GGCT)/AIG2-like uncharacterized protein YtfP